VSGPAPTVSASPPAARPIRVHLDDDLRRSRLTVFFRVLLAIPHVIWVVLWGIAAVVAVIAAWFATLVKGQSPAALHNFLAAYVRYSTHVSAYLFLVANPFPGFTGGPGRYPIDVEIAQPARQNRWTVGFRIFLALPALLLAGALGTSGAWGRRSKGGSLGVLGALGFLSWFVGVALGRVPRSLRNLAGYALDYEAQAAGYLLLLTDRYPNCDPTLAETAQAGTSHPIRLTVADDGRRSRLTVFFRILLVIPHVIWLALWTVAAILAALADWFATLVRGQSPAALHNFLAAFLRYETHVFAYLYLVANPFPGFTGTPGTYPVELHIGPPQRQNRWKVGFRIFLAVPAFALSSALSSPLFLAGLFGWFVGLATGRMPTSLRNLGAFALRYGAQVSGYLLLLTETYPDTTPLQVEGAEATPAPASLTA
jgi:hypothetical protein